MTFDELERLMDDVALENDDGRPCSHPLHLVRFEECWDALSELRRQMEDAQALITALLPDGLDAAEANASEPVKRALAAFRASWAL